MAGQVPFAPCLWERAQIYVGSSERSGASEVCHSRSEVSTVPAQLFVKGDGDQWCLLQITKPMTGFHLGS